jgi:creatinine amidohydrolase/Fe(II)-dependent formamide hydrolase-like protein
MATARRAENTMTATTVKRTACALGASMLASVIAVEAAQLAGAAGQERAPDPRSRSLRDCRDNPYNCVDTPNPLSTPDTVWLEEMTWMDVRDALKAGKTTVIIPTGGVEPNGPWLALGKHNYVMEANCEAIARKLGDALCAPIIKHVPEGSIEPPSGSMITVGTISVRRETFEAILTDTAHSLKVHGFQNIIFVGDSGGNQSGQKAVAEALNAKWNGNPVVAHIAEYYDNASVQKFLVSIGVTKENQMSDNLHDEPFYTYNMMIADLDSIRWAQRVKAGKATIDGVSLADKAKSLEIARKVVDFRATTAVTAIKKAIANKGRPATP